jgi:hypothetical protein
MTPASIKAAPTDATVAVLSAASGSADASAPQGAADFLAAILHALAPLTAGTPGDATAGPDGQPADAGDDSTEGTDTDPAALGLVAPTLLPAGAPVPLPGAAAGTGPAAGGGLGAVVGGGGAGAAVAVDGGAGGGDVDGRANLAPGTDVTSPSPASDIRMAGYAVGTSANTDARGTTPATPDGPARSTGDATRAASGPHTTAGDGRVPAADPSGASAPEPLPQPGALTPSGVAPVTGTPTSAPDAPAPAGHVTRQVFPEVTSLVTRGDGTHRITLSLKPEALGEVRVVMTVRDGVVHVRLAAGHDAQRALLAGSPELTRLLEAAGASESRVVVRDLGATSSTPGAGTGQDVSPGLGDSRAQDQHAGTRAQHPATDGTNDPRSTRGATGANPPRSVEPVTRTRNAGVDVTM